MKTHCLLGVVLSSGDTAVDAKRRVPGALELALRRGQANQPADWRPCQMALTAVSERNAGEGEGVQGGEEDDISQLARGVLPPNMLERYPKEEGASYPCLGGLTDSRRACAGTLGAEGCGTSGLSGMCTQCCPWYRPENRHIEDENVAESRGQGETLGSGQRFSREGKGQSLGGRERRREDQSASCVRGLDGEFYGPV